MEFCNRSAIINSYSFVGNEYSKQKHTNYELFVKLYCIFCIPFYLKDVPSWSVGITPICWFQDLQTTIYSVFWRFWVVSRDNVHFWDGSDTPVGIMFSFENCPIQGGQMGIWSRDNVQNVVGIMFSFGLSRDNVQNIETAHQVSFLVTRWSRFLETNPVGCFISYSVPQCLIVRRKCYWLFFINRLPGQDD